MKSHRRLSPNFFRRCEREYPNAVGFVRRHIPLGWPAPEEAKPEQPFSISMSSKELEEEVTRILQQVDPVAVEEEEAVEEAIAPEEVNSEEMNHLLSVLSAARAMMEAEMVENAKNEAEIVAEETPVKEEVPVKEEKEEKKEIPAKEKKEAPVKKEDPSPAERQAVETLASLTAEVAALQSQLKAVATEEAERVAAQLEAQKAQLEEEVMVMI